MDRGSLECLLGSGFSGRTRGGFLRADDIFTRLTWGVITEEHRRKGPAHVPFDVVGEHAEKDVCAYAALQTVMDGAHLEINGFEATEGLFYGAQVFVALHRF